MSESVRGDRANLVTLAVLVNGKVIPDIYYVTEIRVEHEVNRIPFASVTIADGSAVDEDFVASASAVFVPGGEMEIKLGYHAKNKSVFKGLILRQNIRVDASGNSSLIVGCHDKTIKTTLGRSSAGFAESTDSDAMSRLLRDSGLTANVASTSPKLEYQIKHFATDWDFILSRAEANGFVVIVTDGAVNISAPEFSKPKLAAEYGDTISRLDLELTAIDQYSDIKASAWDPTTQTVVSGASSEPKVNKQGDLSGEKLAQALAVPTHQLQTPAPASEAELKDWADAQLLKSRLSRIRGSVEFTGNAELEVGDLLDLGGLGKRFNGAGYVAAVSHHVAEGNWSTEVELGLSARWFSDTNRDVSAPQAGGRRPAAGGLHIGKVEQIHDDPAGERRVKVALPLSPDADEGVWVRNVSPYATGNAGIEFMPEPGDEVVLGFLDNDPNAAVILGSLHSSAIAAPVVPDETNTVKTIVTRSQLKISFDDEKKIITIETPGGHIACLNDEETSITLTDSSANTVTMNESGIAMDSPKDIKVTASGSISIKGQAGVDIESPADVGVKGANVSVEAQAALTAKGGASAQLSASGQTTVKGAMVMIN